jgi:hypothetical protein
MQLLCAFRRLVEAMALAVIVAGQVSPSPVVFEMKFSVKASLGAPVVSPLSTFVCE